VLLVHTPGADTIEHRVEPPGRRDHDWSKTGGRLFQRGLERSLGRAGRIAWAGRTLTSLAGRESLCYERVECDRAILFRQESKELDYRDAHQLITRGAGNAPQVLNNEVPELPAFAGLR